jgi:hypothetical protein
MNGDARCGIEPPSPGRGCDMIFQKSQPAETEYERLSSASTGPLKNMDTSSPAPKAHAHEMQKKN